jgi:hypothetical protein
MDLLDSAQDFEVADVEINACSYRRHHGLPRTRGTMDRESALHQVFHYPLDVFLGRRFLHCYDHKKVLAISLWPLA